MFVYGGAIHDDGAALPSVKGSRLVLMYEGGRAITDRVELQRRELSAHGEDFFNAAKRQKVRVLAIPASA